MENFKKNRDWSRSAAFIIESHCQPQIHRDLSSTEPLDILTFAVQVATYEKCGTEAKSYVFERQLHTSTSTGFNSPKERKVPVKAWRWNYCWINSSTCCALLSISLPRTAKKLSYFSLSGVHQGSVLEPTWKLWYSFMCCDILDLERGKDVGKERPRGRWLDRWLRAGCMCWLCDYCRLSVSTVLLHSIWRIIIY